MGKTADAKTCTKCGKRVRCKCVLTNGVCINCLEK